MKFTQKIYFIQGLTLSWKDTDGPTIYTIPINSTKKYVYSSLKNSINNNNKQHSLRQKSPYVSQYYAAPPQPSNNVKQNLTNNKSSILMKREDLWLIDKQIRRMIRINKKLSCSNNQQNSDTEDLSSSSIISDDSSEVFLSEFNYFCFKKFT